MKTTGYRKALVTGGHALIIANGSLPDPVVMRKLVRAADLLVCADGGANLGLRLAIRPDIIIGDFDSISSKTRRAFRTVSQLHISDQESTDLEKAIVYCINAGYRRIVLTGATGDRLDHSVGGLGCFRKFGRLAELALVDTVGVLTAINDRVTIYTHKGERLSLIPLGRCTGVRTRNLRFPLQNETLEAGVRDGISNEALGTCVTISIGHGTLLLYRFFDEHAPLPFGNR